MSICTDTMTNSMPMSRSMAISPRSPRMRNSDVEDSRITALSAHATVIASMTGPNALPDALSSSSSVASVDGPATSGMASGTMKGSPCNASPDAAP